MKVEKLDKKRLEVEVFIETIKLSNFLASRSFCGDKIESANCIFLLHSKRLMLHQILLILTNSGTAAHVMLGSLARSCMISISLPHHFVFTIN